MKVYRGEPGDPPKVTVSDETGTRDFKGVEQFDWGDGFKGSTNLALAILIDHFGDNFHEAGRLHHRFKYRTVANWKRGEPWMITEAEIMGHLAEIRRVEQDPEIIAARKKVDLEPPPIANAMGADVTWKN